MQRGELCKGSVLARCENELLYVRVAAYRQPNGRSSILRSLGWQTNDNHNRQSAKNSSMKLAKFALFAALLIAGFSSAEARFSYSGGYGDPLFITLDEDISFTLNQSGTAAYGIGITVPDAFATLQPSGGTSVTVINGLTLTSSLQEFAFSQVTFGVPQVGIVPGTNTAGLDAHSCYLFFSVINPQDSPVLNFAAGEVLTLSAGTGFTAGGFDFAPPTDNGTTPIVVHDGYANLIADSIPEPSTWLLMSAGIPVFLGTLRLRKRVA